MAQTTQSASQAKEKVTRTLIKNAESTFATEYQRLNPAQKQAVDTIEGPVMVVAGPGTGKTQVVALRVSNILQKTQLRPGNILCLTYSTSGSTAMRERLRSLMGSDAYGVTVNTIHGFANDIIQQNPIVFEEWSTLEQISDVERYRSLNKIIDSLLPDMDLVNKKSPYMRTRQILSRISQLKREGVTDRATLLGVADQHDAHMSHLSKEGTKAHEKNLLMARKFRGFLDVFFLYQEMLEHTGRYDYEDMILRVIQALEQEDWLLASLQERYQYVLVDEFQDTNGAQYRLIELLTTDPTGDHHPNLFVVGDDDQAIYRFQGANLQNILSFRDRFPTAPAITLTTSYRCSQTILDAAGHLIEHNTERLVGKIEGLQKNLIASSKEEGITPVLLHAPSDMVEPWIIADLIEERLEKGIAAKDIAILVQTNRELEPLYDVLRAREILVQMSGKVDLLSHPLVGQCIAILKAIHHPHESSFLATALSCDCFDCHPADLGRIFNQRREEKSALYDVLLKIEESDLSLNDAESVIKARDVLIDLHNKISLSTVLQTVEHVMKDSNLIPRSLADTAEVDPLHFAPLQEFFDRIKQRAYEQPGFSFELFMSDLEFYGQKEYSDIRLSYSLPHLSEEGVQLMTAHRSKGLEFHTVILANFRDRHWDRRRNPPSVSIPEDLLFGWQKDQKSFEQNQDERRVAFVAMTRAKRELIFTCPTELTTGDSAKTVAPSAFFAEAGDITEVHAELKNPEEASTLLVEPVRKLDEEMQAFLRERIENFALSPTALNDFLEDPQCFVERHLLMVPQARDPNYAYGNAVHHVLARWAHFVQEGKPMTKDAVLKEFKSHLREKELLTNDQKESLEHLGEETLSRYFDERLSEPYPIIHKIEYGLKAHIQDIPIKGKIDRIDLLEPHSSAAVVTDFKTGKPKSPAKIEEYGYHRQLVFYALLLENGYSALEPKEFVLDFVGEGSEHSVLRPFIVSTEDKKELTELIQAVWAKITALDFTKI